MRQPSLKIRRFCVSLLVLLHLDARHEIRGAASPGNNTGPAASMEDPLSASAAKLDYQTDLFSGRFGYTVPIVVPPGRNGSEPSLALRYSSAAENGWCGLGWELEIGYIQRETRNGVPVKWSTSGTPLNEYDDAKGFIFSLNGASSRLMNISGNEFRAEIDSAFLRFNYQTNSGGNSWMVTDKGGNKYFFGQTTDSRMANGKAGWPSNQYNGTFRWALNKVQTVTGTTNSITYTNYGGAQYPLAILYNGHTTGILPNNKIEFVLEGRSDKRLAYNSGYRVETTNRLAKIYCKVGSTVVRRYDLSYTNSLSTLRSLLTSVKVYGLNEVQSLPAITFGYQNLVRGFQSVNWTNVTTGWPNTTPPWTTPSGENPSGLVSDLVDMDGDGLPDRLLRRTDSDSIHTNYFFQRNTGSGFANLETNRWGPLTVQPSTNPSIPAAEWDYVMGARTRLVDLNGDGRPDHVMDPIESAINAPNELYTHFIADLNHGTGWSTSNLWPNVKALYQLNTPLHRAIENIGYVRLIDMNGDGLPDRVLHRTTFNPPYTNWWVQFNTGTGFTATNRWGKVYCQGLDNDGNWGSIDYGQFAKLIDMNGDGLPDRVLAPISGTGIDYNNFNRLAVQFNNGYGFEDQIEWGPVDFKADLPTGVTSTPWSYIEQTGYASLRDINGDGLPDRILGKYTTPFTNYFVQFNTGSGFTAQGTNNLYVFGPPDSQSQTNDRYFSWIDNGNLIRFIDINGDGLSDRVMTVYPGTDTNKNWFVADLAKGPIPDLLTTVSNGIGGSLKVAYKSSSNYNNRETTDASSRGLLMIPVQTVAALAVSDGLYPAYTNSFSYEGGFYDPVRREFAGFCCVSVTNALGQVTRHWFHQGGGRDNSSLGEFDDSGKFSKRGIRFRTEIVGTDSQTYQITLNKVDEYAYAGTGRRFPFISQAIQMDYPGNGGPYRASAGQFFYDTNTGNQTNLTEFGEVTNVVVNTHAFGNAGAGDDVYQITFYANLSNPDILDRPSTNWVAADPTGSTLLRETINTYDGGTGNLLQRLQRICPGSYLANRFSYDAYGNVYVATNEAGIVTYSTYETTKTFPSQQTAATFTNSFVYDLNSGTLLWSKDPKGLVRSNAFDGFYRLSSAWVSDTPNGSPNVWLERYQYSLGGISGGSSANYVRLEKNDTTSANPASGHDTYTYMDGLARVVQIRTESETNNYYRVSQKVFNEWGALKVETQPVFLTGASYSVLTISAVACAFSEYDPVGRLKQTTAPMNANFSSGLLTGTPTAVTETGSLIGPLQISYNDGNNPWALVVTDEAGAVSGLVRKFLLDGFGRTNQIVDVANSVAYATNTLVYDRVGLVTNIIDAANNKIEYAYNDLGQMIAMADPDLGYWQYVRDFAGRLKDQIDAKGQRARFNYNDALGRLKTRNIYNAAGSLAYTVTYAYDTGGSGFTVYKGQLASVTDSQGAEKYSYDVRGRTLKIQRSLLVNNITYTNEFTFDSADRVTSVKYTHGGPTVTNLYDAAGNLTKVQHISGSPVYFQAKGYNEIGQLLGINFGNNTETTNSYFVKTRRLQGIVSKKSGASTNYQNLAYTYNQVADLTAITDGIFTSGTNSGTLSSIGYDNLHRLTSLTRPGPVTTTFAYDRIGNVSTNGEESTSTYIYNSNGLLAHAVKTVGSKKYAYDLCGNMVHRNGQALAYDLENRLFSVTKNGIALATFGYSDDGERLWKQGTNTLHVWIGNLFESRASTNLYHIYAGTRRVATYSPAVKLPGASGNTDYHFYHPDHLGSSSLITDATGALAEHYEYTAYGRERANGTATPDASHRFTGQIFDQDTGLYYYGARYYDPELARFVQPDTIIPSVWNPQSWNRYSYAYNNPLKFIDPSGHAGEDGTAPRVSLWQKARMHLMLLDPKNAGRPILVGGPAANQAIAEQKKAAEIIATANHKLNQIQSLTPEGQVKKIVKEELAKHQQKDVVTTDPPSPVDQAAQGLTEKAIDAVVEEAVQGGAYKDVPAEGGEVHHAPADSVSPLTRDEGPGFRMETEEHRKTASWGRAKEAQAYRQKQKELINQGKFKEAQQMDIDDARKKFGEKYNKAIDQMQKYTDKIPAEKLKPKE